MLSTSEFNEAPVCGKKNLLPLKIWNNYNVVN